MVSKAKVFIGSATETISLAHDLQECFDDFAEVTVWDQDVFGPSVATIAAITAMSQSIDFAIFIFTPTDIVKIGDQTSSAARDNVILELGLFAGQIGIERCFIVLPQNLNDFHLPSDMAFITPCKYNPERSDGNMVRALATACNQIKRRIEILGLNKVREVFALEKQLVKSFPASISSSFISGLWLSRFEYTAYRNEKFTNGFQFDIELLEGVDESNLTGKNYCACSPDLKVYFHDLKLQIVNNYVLGQWYNVNTKNFGSFQLTIKTHLIVMDGVHTGNANDHSVQSGKWTWVRITDPALLYSKEWLAKAQLKAPEEIEKVFLTCLREARPLTLSKVINVD